MVQMYMEKNVFFLYLYQSRLIAQDAL